MRSYLNGTWSTEWDGPLPVEAAVDSFLQRYGWTVDEYLDTDEDWIQRLGAVIAGEQDHHEDQTAKHEAQAASERRRAGGGATAPHRPLPPSVPAEPGSLARDAWESGLPLPGADPILGA